MTNRYETHITLSNCDPSVLELARQWAQSQGMKWTQILLDAGRTPLQPMITLWGTGSVAGQRQRIENVIHAIVKLGGAVVRVKIEGNLENDDVPQSDSGILASPSNYFEHHIKVLMTDPSELEGLRVRATKHQARLSQNARRQRADGRFERFVTQRVSGCGRAKAAEQLERLLHDFVQHDVVILEVEAEYVLHDSNVEIDSDWF